MVSRVHDRCLLTTSLDTEVHLRVGGVGNSVTAEIHGGANSVSDTVQVESTMGVRAGHSLLHDGKSQRITHGVAFTFKLE